MGSVAMRKPDNVRAWFEAELTQEGDGVRQRVLDSALVNRNAIYGAVETVQPDGSREVWAAVYRVQFFTPDEFGHSFLYKEQSENAGPLERECPGRILDLLTPTRSKWANEWRDACRARLARRAANSLADGDVVRFPRVLEFTDGARGDLFEASVRGRAVGFRRVDPETGETQPGLYRIVGWRDTALERVDRTVLASAVPRP